MNHVFTQQNRRNKKNEDEGNGKKSDNVIFLLPFFYAKNIWLCLDGLPIYMLFMFSVLV